MTTTSPCPTWCDDHTGPNFPGDTVTHMSRPVTLDGGSDKSDLGVYLIQDIEDREPEVVIRDTGDVYIPLSDIAWVLKTVAEVAARAEKVTPNALKTMRMVASAADEDLDEVAADFGVDLGNATMAELNSLGRVLGRSLAHGKDVTVSVSA